MDAPKNYPLDKKAAKAELKAMIERLGNEEPSQADKERAAILMGEITRGDPLVIHLTQAVQLVESVESTSRPLETTEKCQLIATLAMAGDQKISLFSAMRKIAKTGGNR